MMPGHRHWRKQEVLLGLYCIALLHNIVFISAAPATIQDTRRKIKPPETIRRNTQISKRSTSDHVSATLPDESVSNCAEDPSLCSRKPEIWNNQDYSDNYPQVMSSDTNSQSIAEDKYYDPYAQEDNNQVSLYHRRVPNESQFPKIVILALPKTDKSQEGSSEEQPIQEVKKNIFTSRGWGAGGMPFSVLYLHQQQRKPAARSPIAGAHQMMPIPQPLRGFPSQYRQVAVRNALSSALTAPNNVVGMTGGGGGAPLPTRRQYSIIPQLYVSYGWGPHGK